MTDEIYPCPCCGWMEFTTPPGSYGICSICGWEDDTVQLLHPLMSGGANSESLFDCQQQILSEIPPEVAEYHGQKRAADWRPLTKEEFSLRGVAPETGLEYFYAVAGDRPEYYWKKRK